MLGAFGTLAVGALALAGARAGCGATYMVLACGGGGAHLAWQLATLDVRRTGDWYTAIDMSVVYWARTHYWVF